MNVPTCWRAGAQRVTLVEEGKMLVVEPLKLVDFPLQLDAALMVAQLQGNGRFCGGKPQTLEETRGKAKVTRARLQ
jgi:hypothetical protein